MGQLCSFCGSQEEAKKSTAFTKNANFSEDAPDPDRSTNNHNQASEFSRQQTPETVQDGSSQNVSLSHGHEALTSSGDPNTPSEQIDEKERERRLKQFQLEQAELARREIIVNTASQSMVPVGGSQSASSGMMHHQRVGGIYTYYDPAYAAAAAQDILNSAARTGGLIFVDDDATRAAWVVNVVGEMPKGVDGATEKDLIDALGKGRWDDVRLGSRDSGIAGCGGENPEYFLDDLAEAYLEAMVPTKTNLFSGCPSIVENLL